MTAVASAVDKAVYTAQEQAQDDAADVAGARAFTVAPSWGTLWDSIIDGWHRAIRPAFATWVLGIVTGFWSPPLERWRALPAEAWALIITIVTFYFGGRTIMKDILPGLARLIGEWRKA